MRRLSRDAALADDLAQQVFIRVWRTVGQLHDPLRFPGWLKRLEPRNTGSGPFWGSISGMG
jgi:DNA-directed RNA polymerase specialized sigma24 family protein